FNVVLFGVAGCGKTSVLNMTAEHDLQTTTNKVDQVPFSFSSHDISPRTSDQKVINLRIWDTEGLNEGNTRSDSSRQTQKNMEKLVEDVNKNGGLHLLVLCIRASRITDIEARNYAKFKHDVCQDKVNIVVVVTGLESEELGVDQWWGENEKYFDRYGMKFHGHACIVATMGKMVNGVHKYKKEYEASRTRV
ncbi:hypothetical protein K435DRAFT_581768, partial [Dendrothele bispora CBS 962.96]